eukprot:gene9339-12583_t
MSNFNARVSQCIFRVQQLLEEHKVTGSSVSSTLLDSVDHSYNDKYILAEMLTRVLIASVLNTLLLLNLTFSFLFIAKDWRAGGKTVSLQLKATSTCIFLKEIKHEVVDASRVETERTINSLLEEKITTKIVTTITAYEYEYKVDYELILYSGVGTNQKERLTLIKQSLKRVLVTRCKALPYSSSTSEDPSTNISWLIDNCSVSDSEFTIDRLHSKCFTPSNNNEISQALRSCSDLFDWSKKVENVFWKLIFDVQEDFPGDGDSPHLVWDADSVFIPISPLMLNDNNGYAVENDRAVSSSSNSTGIKIAPFPPSNVTFGSNLLHGMLSEHLRSLQEKVSEREKSCSKSTHNSIFTKNEMKILVLMKHLLDLKVMYHESIAFIETTIRNQLISAIGKEVSSSDFSDYMIFHSRLLFKENFQPKPFSYSIRRSLTHSPEGLIRIQKGGCGSSFTPSKSNATNNLIYSISTSSTSNESHEMSFPINASTKIRFCGDRYLHAIQCHSFSNEQLKLSLVAQARQFSSFIVIIGRIVSATLFEPKCGFIVQNKDEITVPLELSRIPTAKEFRDAIESLSPEQQRFATSFRSMQLESTLFAICVIQIKPQLEKALNLPLDSLTKEIRLTQDLTELFIKYQIPTDLLSYPKYGNDENNNNSTHNNNNTILHSQDETAANNNTIISVSNASVALAAVKNHVKSIQSIIQDSKLNEIEESVYKIANFSSYVKSEIEEQTNLLGVLASEESSSLRLQSQQLAPRLATRGASRSSFFSAMPSPPQLSFDSFATLAESGTIALSKASEFTSNKPVLHKSVRKISSTLGGSKTPGTSTESGSSTSLSKNNN